MNESRGTKEKENIITKFYSGLYNFGYVSYIDQKIMRSATKSDVIYSACTVSVSADAILFVNAGEDN